MNKTELNDKAEKYLSDSGFGTGSNITLDNVKSLIVGFYLENQIKSGVALDELISNDSISKGQSVDTLKDFDADINEYESEFECSQCMAIGQESFNYNRTVSNGEVWDCKVCNSELLTSHQPNEDKY